MARGSVVLILVLLGSNAEALTLCRLSKSDCQRVYDIIELTKLQQELDCRAINCRSHFQKSQTLIRMRGENLIRLANREPRQIADEIGRIALCEARHSLRLQGVEPKGKADCD